MASGSRAGREAAHLAARLQPGSGGATEGVKPNNMCILKGFPTNLATSTTMFPFGMWFANDHTLYVADEGSGDNTYSDATGEYTNATADAQPAAGLEKWVFDTKAGEWHLAYTLQKGLNLGQPYTIPGYPTGINDATGLPVVTRHRRPAGADRPRQSRRNRHDLGDHLDREWRRRPGRRPGQARDDQRPAGRHHAEPVGELLDGSHGRVRPDPARGLVHPRNQARH